jgi:hypothetical protein
LLDNDASAIPRPRLEIKAPGTLPGRLIQMVSRFRPDADGVGEFALRLADILSNEHRIPGDLLVYNPPGPEPELGLSAGVPHAVKNLKAGGGAALNQALDRYAASSASSPVLLLHYVSYGYSPHGTPFWLPEALERFTAGGGRLLTFFHELYALPRFPARTFFTSGLQRRIFRRVLAASEVAFTSNEEFMAAAQRDNRRNRPIGLVGICSTAGEPENPQPLAQRARRLAVFGRFLSRRRLYSNQLDGLERIARHLEIEEIADIGAIDDRAWMDENVLRPMGRLVHPYGTLSLEAASRLLEDSLVGALDYSYGLRGKSGIFAAYQAHATPILLFPEKDGREQPPPGGWTLGADDLLALPPGRDAQLDRLQRAADEGRADYLRHRSARAMAEKVLSVLQAGARTP